MVALMLLGLNIVKETSKKISVVREKVKETLSQESYADQMRKDL